MKGVDQRQGTKGFKLLGNRVVPRVAECRNSGTKPWHNVQQNSENGKDSKDGGVIERSNDTTLTRWPAATGEACTSESGGMNKLTNERYVYVQPNSKNGKDSRGWNDRKNITTLTRWPAATESVRSFPPDTTDRIPSCLEEEFPRYATATENFPPEINKEDIRRCYNDYQHRIDWCSDRSPCGICGGSFQSDSVKFYSQERLLELENQHELDCCAVHEDGVYLCSTCGRDLELKRRMSVPKFSGVNWVNKSLCQHRPSVHLCSTISLW